MRLKIHGNNVLIARAQNWEQLFTKTHEYNNIALTYYVKGGILGGWIKLPIRFQFEFDALAYSLHRISRLSILEITVETANQLKQISHHLLGSLEPFKEANRPIFYQSIDLFITEANHLLDEFYLIVDKAETEMSLQEATNFDWRSIHREIDHYLTVLSASDLPSEYNKEAKSIYTKMSQIKGELTADFIFDLIFNREFECYQLSYQQHLDSFHAGNFDLQSLNNLLNAINALNASIILFWERIYRFNHRYASKVLNVKDELIAELKSLKISVLAEIDKLLKFHQLEQRQKVVGRLLLQQLQLLTPGIQTLLTRISELIDVDVSTLEETMLKLLDKYPELGSYDKLSQVFILSKNMSTRIDAILKEYPSASFDDFPIALKNGETVDNE